MKKKIAIIGATGMLGSMVYHVLSPKYELIVVYKDKKHLKLLNKVYGGVRKHKAVEFDISSLYEEYKKGFASRDKSKVLEKLVKKIGKVHIVVNCAGVIKPHSLKNPELTFFINGSFPHLLSEVYGEKLIQITTDCVYSGKAHAPYNEKSSFSPNDLYGISKNLGEPSQKSLVLRTSIIGPELHSGLSLIDWFKSQKGEVKGFINHYWNGITTREFANVVDKIVQKRTMFPKHGLYHIFSTDITKYELLLLLQKKYNTNVKVNPVKAEPVDRRLRTIHTLRSRLSIPPLSDMINEL